MKKLILKIINLILKIFNIKLIKIVDQFDGTYRLTLALNENNIDYLFDIGANEGQFSKELWKRMKKANKGNEPPQFMSTHPSSTNRIKNLKEWENSVILDYPPISIS